MVCATAVILNLSAASESVLAELWALDHLGSQKRTFVVIGSGFEADWLNEEERETLDRFPQVAHEEAIDLEEQLNHFLSGLLE